MSNDPFNFNFSDFKKWISHSKEEKDSIVGCKVELKESTKKLSLIAEVIEGDARKVLKDFRINGGIITEKFGNIITIETNNGKIELNKLHVVIS